MKTVKVTFAAEYVPGLDTLFTYKTSDSFTPGDIAWTERNGEVSKVQVVSIDKEYDTKAEERFGTLAEVHSMDSYPDQDIPRRARL